MTPGGAAFEGLFRMLENDSALTLQLGSGTRIFAGWPGDTLDAADFPRLTLYTFGPAPLRPGFQRVRATVTEWVWASGSSGGLGKLLTIDERVTELLNEQRWEFGGHRMWSYAGGWRDDLSAESGRLRRDREIIIEASKLE